MSHDKSLNFLIYAFYAVMLWCGYLGLTRIYFNLVEDALNAKEQIGLFGLDMDYGKAATLVLISTVGLFVTRAFSLKLSKSGSVSLDAGSRIWMLRLILLAASLSAISDVYILITSFMVGTGTAIELIEALITLVVAFGIIMFCVLELQLKTMANRNVMSLYSFLYLVLATITFASAVYKAPPWIMRLVRQDHRTLSKMNEIGRHIDQYYTKHKRVPENLTLLEEYVNRDELVDPMTDQLFVYKVIDDKTYEMCGEFRTDRLQAPRRNQRLYGRFDKFNYQKGKSCFQLQAHQY
jgi:hypothetical protein